MIGTQTLKFDFNKKEYKNVFILNQGDVAVPFKVELYNNGIPYELLASDMVTLEWKKPNKKPFFQSTGITRGDKYIEFVTPEAVAQFAGTGFVNVILTDTENNNKKGTIQRFFEVVESGANPKEISEGTISDVVRELKAFIAENQVATKADLAALETKLDLGAAKLINDDEISTSKTFSSAKIDYDYLKVADLPKNVSAFLNDAEYITKSELLLKLISYAEKDDIPANTSDLVNDSGFIDNTVSDLLNYYTKLETYTKEEVDGLVDGVAKSVDIPTKVSDLENDSEFITATVNNLNNYYLKTDTYSCAEINTLLNNVSKLTVEVVESLPVLDISTTTIYLIADEKFENTYIQYMYINGKWALLGSTQVDLTGYVKTTDLATVATSGSYNDLTDAPELAAVATSGSYNDLLNIPETSQISALTKVEHTALVREGSIVKDGKTIVYDPEAVYIITDDEDTFNPVPTGQINMFAGSTAPVGYFICDGSEVSRTDYAALFAVIGTTYGAGNGTTTFNLPDLRDKFAQGANDNLGTVKEAGLPNITGEFGAQGSTVATAVGTGAFRVSKTGAIDSGNSQYTHYSLQQSFNASRSSSIYGNSDTVQPPALCINYIIKY